MLACVGLNASDCTTTAGRGLPVEAPFAVSTTMERRTTSPAVGSGVERVAFGAPPADEK